MVYKVILCDDSDSDRDYIAKIVEKWAAANGNYVKLTNYSSAENFVMTQVELKNEGRAHICDILLLDIEMGRMNGVELAKKVRAVDKEVQIIFVTGFNDYIADGYDVEALNYLIKPVSELKLFSVLDKAAAKLKKNERALCLRLNDGIVMVPLYEIRCIEVRGNYITVRADDEITVKSTLSHIENELDEDFFKIGRSFIVNLTYIRRVLRTEITLSDGTILPLPRGMYEKVNRAIIERL